MTYVEEIGFLVAGTMVIQVCTFDWCYNKYSTKGM